VIRTIVFGLALLPSVAAADRGAPCEAGSCDVDPGPRPWILDNECQDASDVVGYRQCSSFGRWSAAAAGPQLVFAAGVGVRHVVVPAVPAVASARGTTVEGTPVSDGDITTTVFRVTGVERGFYAGLEVELGDLTGRAYPYGSFLQSGAVLGGQLRLGPVDFGSELLAAGRSSKRVGRNQPAAASLAEPEVELRARAQVWVSAWLTIDGALGTGLLDRSERFAAVTLGFHTRSFGADR